MPDNPEMATNTQSRLRATLRHSLRKAQSTLEETWKRAAAGVTFVRFCAFGAIFLLASIFFNQYGFLHPELARIIPHHFSGESVFRLVFYTPALDWITNSQGQYIPCYQGREISYLVDHFDFLAVAKSVQYGFPCFVGLSHLVFSFLAGCLLWRFLACQLEYDRLTASLFVFLLWSSPYIYTHNIFRSGKIAVALGSVLLVSVLYRVLHGIMTEKSPGSYQCKWTDYALVFVISLATSLFDRQGLYYQGIAVLLLFVISCAGARKRGLLLTLPIFLAVGANMIYFRFIGPYFSMKFYGINPGFGFNTLPTEGLTLAQTSFLAKDSFSILHAVIRHTTGSFSFAIAIGMLAAFALILLVADWRRASRARSAPLVAKLPYLTISFAIVLILSWIMYFAMEMRHPPITWPDLRLFYYGIPTAAITIMTMSIGLHIVRKQASTFRKIPLGLVLIVMLIGNLTALPGHRRTVDNGNGRVYIALSPFMRDALLNIYNPNYTPPPGIRSDATYQALRDYALRESNAAKLLVTPGTSQK